MVFLSRSMAVIEPRMPPLPLPGVFPSSACSRLVPPRSSATRRESMIRVRDMEGSLRGGWAAPPRARSGEATRERGFVHLKFRTGAFVTLFPGRVPARAARGPARNAVRVVDLVLACYRKLLC